MLKTKQEEVPLYQIADHLNSIISSVIENNGELSDEQILLLQKWTCSFHEKISSICWLIQKLEAEMSNAKIIEDKAKQYRKTRESTKERLRRYIADCMEEAKQPSISADIFKINLMPGKEKLVIDTNVLPPELIEEVVKVDLKPKTDEIKSLLQSGVELPGVTIEKGENYVTIR